MAVGEITRGTTGNNRLRRVDRYIASHPNFLNSAAPVVVDLGYGARPVTAVELFQRLKLVKPEVELIGVEIDPERVSAAQSASQAGLSFIQGGFEIPIDSKKELTIIRALNVLRQYSEASVIEHWKLMTSRLSRNGILVEGTCNEIGRVASWFTVNPSGPQSFTISLRLNELEQPSIVAERLPKLLIHRNVPGEKIHKLLKDLDLAWATHSGLGALSPVQRWQATHNTLKQIGYKILTPNNRVKLGELTLPFEAVTPLGFVW